MSFQPLGKLINKNIKKGKLAGQVEIALALEEFDNVIKKIWGKEILEKVKGMSIKEGILKAAVLSSAAGQEIKLREKEIIAAVNNKLNKKLVEYIRIQM